MKSPERYPCLVLLDIDRIHDYVFYPARLRFIRGASYLLDRFMRSIEKNFLCGEKYGGYYVIFSNGGTAQILMEDMNNAQEFVKDVQARFSNETITSTMTCHVEPWEESETFYSCQQRTFRGLRDKKRSRIASISSATSIYAKACEECGLLPATNYKTKDKYVCRSCRAKFEAFDKDEQTKLTSFFERDLSSGARYKRPSDFSEIAKHSLPPNHLGLVYVDVNRMGEAEKRLLEMDEDNYVKLQQFSKKVETCLFSAVTSAALKHLDRPYPVEFCLSGGDDIILVVPAQKAVEIACDICLEFEKRWRSDPIPKNIDALNISAGVSLAKGDFPFLAMFGAAEQLLRSAKRMSWEELKHGGNEISAIDFQFLDSGLKALEALRSYGFQDMGRRPFSIENCRIILGQIKEIKETGLPLGRIKKLLEATSWGREQAVLEYCFMLTRVSDEQRRFLRTKFPEPGRDFIPMLPEILELWDFL